MARNILNLVTFPYVATHRCDDDSIIVCYTTENEENRQLYEMLNLPRTFSERFLRRCPAPLLVAINFPEKHGYVCEAPQLDTTTVNEFFTSYVTESLPEEQKIAIKLKQ